MLSDRFRAAIERGDVSAAAELLSEDATFRSPAVFTPYEGRDQIAKVLQAAERVLAVAGDDHGAEGDDSTGIGTAAGRSEDGRGVPEDRTGPTELRLS